MAQRNNYIVGFDVLKFLMAFVIVSLHAGVFKELAQPFGSLCRNFQNLAVPVFFVLSSCLFFDKFYASTDHNLNAIMKYEHRLLILYLIWSVIMIPVTLFLHHYHTCGLQGVLNWVKDFFFDYTFYASWFFGALLVGMPIVFLLRNHPMILLGLSLILYVVFSFYTAMPHWLVTPFEWYHKHLGTPSRSFLFGIVWIGMGCIISRWRVLSIVKQAVTNRWGGVILCLGVIASCLFKPFQIVGVFSLIGLFYSIDDSKFNQRVWVFLRKCSIIIYCVHYVFIHLFWTLHIEKGVFVFILATFFSFAVAASVVILSDKKHIGFLKYLY